LFIGIKDLRTRRDRTRRDTTRFGTLSITIITTDLQVNFYSYS
jgi:hypothetical protein